MNGRVSLSAAAAALGPYRAIDISAANKIDTVRKKEARDLYLLPLFCVNFVRSYVVGRKKLFFSLTLVGWYFFSFLTRSYSIFLLCQHLFRK